MGIDPVLQGLVEHHESIDIIGDVKCWLRDLHEAWDKENARQRIEVTAGDAAVVYAFDIAAARPLVWEHFTLPGHRPKWHTADVVYEKTISGRRGVGTRNHCMHGKDAIVEDVLDWRPFDYVTMSALVPMPGAPRIILTYAFADQPGGTRLEVRIGKPKPKDRAFLEAGEPAFREDFRKNITNLNLILAGQVGAPAVVEEPELLATPERFLTQPVTHRA
jgi:uncharacterized protein YndB with AHSA1/START domain